MSLPRNLRLGVQAKITLLTALFILVTSGSLSWYFIEQEKQIHVADLVKTGRVLAETLAKDSAVAIVAQDQGALLGLVNRVARDPDVVFAIVDDDHGGVLAQIGAISAPEVLNIVRSGAASTAGDSNATERLVKDSAGAQRYDIAIPIFRKRLVRATGVDSPQLGSPEPTEWKSLVERVGVARVGLSPARINAEVAQRRRGSILLTSIVVVLGIAGALLVTQFIVRPLRELESATKRVALGEFHLRVKAQTRDEIGDLAYEFNTMAAKLEEAYAGLEQKVEERTRDVRQALEQQTATSEILRVISQSQRDVQPVFEAIAASARKLCRATAGEVFMFDGEFLKYAAADSAIPAVVDAIKRTAPMPLDRSSSMSRAVVTREVAYIRDVLEDQEYRLHSLAQAAGYRCTLAVPMLRHGTPIGALAVVGAEPAMFNERQIALLKTFADQAIIAIENTRLFNELQERLEQQTATSEILRVISSSPTDLQPVLDTVVKNAARLCASADATLFRVEGDWLRRVSGYGPTVLPEEGLPIRRDLMAGRAIIDRCVVQVSDLLEASDDEFAGSKALAVRLGYRAQLAVPMLREGNAIGVITIRLTEARPFSNRQIDLIKTFADQAVIAIENTRLFNELQARTAELGRSVEELKALGEVGSAVSSTLDVDTVLKTILTRANQLAGTQAGQIFDYDEETGELNARATFGYTEDIVEVLRLNPIRKGEGVTGQAVAKRHPVQVPDIAAQGAYDSRLRDLIMERGFRALLAVPLIRENRVMGALTIARTRPGEFPQQVVDLMSTFASQSALAMQNARLFHQLEIASKHKSQFLANMSHELRTPLNAILGYTELIVDQIYGEVPEKINEVLDRVQKSGRHLLGLINDVLDLSKIEAGQLVLTLSAYSFSDVVQAVVSAVGSLAAEKQLRLTVDVAPDLPVGQGDERRIIQVLLNLVGNAIKFTEKGEVAVRVSASDDTFLVAVADTGPGIKSEDQEKIFEEFQQSDTAVAKSKSGTGLGLAIAKRIVELHGGRIWVESTPGKGSTFFVSLPIKAERGELAAA